MSPIHPDLVAIRSHAFLRQEIKSRLRYMGFNPDDTMALIPMRAFWRALEGTVLALPTTREYQTAKDDTGKGKTT